MGYFFAAMAALYLTLVNESLTDFRIWTQRVASETSDLATYVDHPPKKPFSNLTFVEVSQSLNSVLGGWEGVWDGSHLQSANISLDVLLLFLFQVGVALNLKSSCDFSTISSVLKLFNAGEMALAQI